MLKDLTTVCPDQVMEYFSKEKEMGLAQTIMLEQSSVFGWSGVLSNNLTEQNHFYNKVHDILINNLDTNNGCKKCDNLQKFLQDVNFNIK